MRREIDCNCISNYQEAQQGPRDMSAAPFATSVPWMPIATPMSAWFKAGASLTSQREETKTYPNYSKLIQRQTQDTLQCSFNKNKQLRLRSWQRLGLASVTTWTSHKSLIGETPSISTELLCGLNSSKFHNSQDACPQDAPTKAYFESGVPPRPGKKCCPPRLCQAGGQPGQPGVLIMFIQLP